MMICLVSEIYLLLSGTLNHAFIKKMGQKYIVEQCLHIRCDFHSLWNSGTHTINQAQNVPDVLRVRSDSEDVSFGLIKFWSIKLGMPFATVIKWSSWPSWMENCRHQICLGQMTTCGLKWDLCKCPWPWHRSYFIHVFLTERKERKKGSRYGRAGSISWWLHLLFLSWPTRTLTTMG